MEQLPKAAEEVKNDETEDWLGSKTRALSACTAASPSQKTWTL